MNKYIKLSTPEAFKYFIDHDDTLIPDFLTEIRKKQKDEFHGDACVTIVIPTHRTHPDSDRDPIELKNAITDAEVKLSDILEKRQVWPIAENMREAESTIDHRHNLDSLVLYANEHFSAIVRLPLVLEERVFVGQEFDLRPLYKARQQKQNYYILTVSKQLLRLVEARNDKALLEYDNADFPFRLDRFYEVRPENRQNDIIVDNMEKEFYNDADKSFHKYWIEEPLPLILAGDVKSVSYFEEVMDKRRSVIGRMNGNYDQAPLYKLVGGAAREVARYRESMEKEYMAAIDNGNSAGMLVIDLLEIFAFAGQGMADSLYLNWDFTLEGRITWREIERFNNESYQNELTPADLLSILIADVARNGGKIIFTENGRLDKYEGMVLVRRF